jgi:methionine sulfoxide reductase catalytic subunit
MKSKLLISREEITPEALFLSRRKFMRLAAMFGTAYALTACGVTGTPGETATSTSVPTLAPTATSEPLTDTPNSYEAITNYNNYYEFSFIKEDVARQAANFVTSPWPVEIGGLVDKPQTIDANEIIARYPIEERIYRMRCVEGWSMVIPWNGFSLNLLLDDIGVQAGAKYVKFTTLYAPERMPGQTSGFVWPYVEGLRLDEARHDLTIMASGVYGKPMLAQNGAPLRLVVPWKYGFKSIKAIVKIELVTEQPISLWTAAAPREYGFYSNVNPNVPHPRWSQETERRIGEITRRPTLMFNGYEKEVSYLYEGMDLRANY